MLNDEKLSALRERMIKHTLVNDTAVVVLTASELSELLDVVNITKFICFNKALQVNEIRSLYLRLEKLFGG
jgi:hypothetical protein